MKMLIGGEWVDKEDKIEVRDPQDGALIDCVPRADKADIDRAHAGALKGFEIARRLPTHERIAILDGAARHVQQHYEDFCVTIAKEGSKTIREARKEVSRCLNTLRVSAEEARRVEGETLPFDSFPGAENKVGYYYRFPIGVVVCITPFNDPLNLVAHKLGPAIAGGNAAVLKPATLTPLSAIKLVEAFIAAGLPPQVISVVTGVGSEIGDALVSDERNRMISFTGGVDAGKRIMKSAGLKKIAMELGGNAPVIVWKDADLDWAVESSVSGAFWAAGQNCIGVQRILIHDDVYEPFRDRFVARTKKYRIGNKLDEDCDMGPMIHEDESTRIERWVHEAVDEGATLLCGGTRRGALYEPTVLENVTPAMKVDHDEVYAPVVSLYRVSDLDEAFTQANNVAYGLHSAIFTQNLDIAFRAIHNLDAGGVVVNESTDYRLDSMPFGGVKGSGIGREGIRFALMEMTEPKVVCFNLTRPPLAP
jgi:glyceraldehyde-3-phosphate dehydrogenase (NADP+)